MLSDNDLWKNDEIMAVNAEVGLTFDVLAKLCRAIEAAVLEAQGKQEPVAWAYTINNSHSVFSAEKPPEDAYDEGTLYPLYAAPVVQPDMVMVPREATEAMLDAAMNRYKHVSPEARLHFFQMHRENFRCDYKAMIAAAEWKSNA